MSPILFKASVGATVLFSAASFNATDVSGGGNCCYGGCSGSCQGGWCGQSQAHCEGNCKGKWCPNGPTPPGPPPPPPPPPTPGPPGPPTPPGPPSKCLPFSTPVACHGRLKLGGKYNTQLIDQHGNPVQLKGMSVFSPDWYNDCITQDSVNHIAKVWGIQILRVPMDATTSTWHRMQYVDMATKAGIYAIVDYHYIGTNPIIDNNAKNFWRKMATSYKDHVNVFYELFNEPGPNADWNSVIKPFHEAMLQVIRPIDPLAVVLCGTRRWSQMVWQVPGNEVKPSTNVLYVRHSYASTHKDYDAVSAVLDKIPVFMSEWGVCSASGNGAIDAQSAQTWVDMMAGKSHNPHGVTISWCNWGYYDKQESCAALQSGACSAHSWDRTTQSGNMVKGYLKQSLEDPLGNLSVIV